MEGFNPETTQYAPKNALWLGKAAALAYSDDATAQQTLQGWGLSNYKGFSNPATDTQGFVAGNSDMVIVTFRGTVPDKVKDWLTDMDAVLVEGLNGKVHKGFYDAFLGVWSQLQSALASIRNNGQKLWFTGHSLGAALATLAAAKLLTEPDAQPINGLYTFGQPRTGNQDFSAWFDTEMKARTFRFVNNNDIVPHVPPPMLSFKHEGTFVYYDSDGAIKANEGFWSTLKDGLEGEAKGLWEDHLVPDEIADHFINNYLARLQQNESNNPFQ